MGKEEEREDKGIFGVLKVQRGALKSKRQEENTGI